MLAGTANVGSVAKGGDSREGTRANNEELRRAIAVYFGTRVTLTPEAKRIMAQWKRSRRGSRR